MDLIFIIATLSVLPAWILLIVAPQAMITRTLTQTGLYAVILGAVYAFFLFKAMTGGNEGGFDSLEGVMQLFTVKEAVLAGWIHYLIGDLFLGAYEVRDAKRMGFGRLVMAPVLILTAVMAPIGLAIYFLMRTFAKNSAYMDMGR